ncbi:hypothetical protein [Streptomyces sp. NPDC029003]|uniref:hypothetical protein n=1 Tax=Streptomyces sp. NPDC029003 TaxID=3155125 RepID=UPI0033DBD17A
MDRSQVSDQSVPAAPSAGAEFFWLMTVHTEDGQATQTGTLMWLPESTREQLYHLIRNAMRTRLGVDNVTVLAFVLEPNRLGGAL